MEQVTRYGRFHARPGHAEALVRILLEAAEELDEVPGCRLYLVNRQTDEPDVVWVTELWRSRADLDEALRALAGSQAVAAAAPHIIEPSVIELDVQGGKGINV